MGPTGAESDQRSLPPPAGGVRWTVLTYAAGKVITLAATVVLARILAPADFGVVMLAFVAINVIGLFGDLGLGATIVARQDLDRRGIGTAFTLILAAGTALGVLLAAVAGPLSDALSEPRLRGVLTALAPLTVLGAVTWFYQWLFQRNLAFRSRFFGFLAQSSVYAVVAVGAASLGAGVWSIVVGHLAGQTAMAVVWLALAGPVRPRFDRSTAKDLLHSSRGFFLQNAAMLGQQNVDYIAVGRTLGATPLGFYSMAFRLSELPVLAIADPVTKVTFPTYSQMRAAGDDVRDHYLATLRLVAVVTAPLAALLSAASAPLTRLVYGPKWAPMATTLAILAVWGAAKSAHATVEWFLNAIGGAGAAGVVAAGALAVEAPALFVAADRGGIAAVAWVILASVVVSGGALVACVRRRVGLSAAAHGRALWPPFTAAAGAWAVTRAVTTLMGRSAFLGCVASVAAGAAAYLALIAVLAPGVLALAARTLRGTVQGDAPAVLVPEPSAPGGGGRAAADQTEGLPGEQQPTSPRNS